MRRREFLSALSGAAASWPLAARAQQSEKTRNIGVLILGAESDPEQRSRFVAFREAIVKLGWAEGRNIKIDYQFTSTDPDRIRSYVTGLIKQAPEVILANGTPILEALRKQTNSIPIVFVGVSDPVAAGFVPSLARPGGNITGFSNFEYSISGKWFELLKKAAPTISRMGVLLWMGDSSWSRYLAPVEAIAPSRGVQLTKFFFGRARRT